MATWVDRYEVVPALDNTRGPHYQVVQINTRGTRKVLHRYKAEDVANLISNALTAEIVRELP